MILLGDGTHVSLNTATRVRVTFESDQRTVRLVEGEALFEVAKDARRPFVVQAGGSEVRAIGTVFSVRMAPEDARESSAVAVTLIQGRVTVGAEPSPWGQGAAASRPPLQLEPGDRVRVSKVSGFSSNGPRADVRMDRPSIGQVMAWRRGEAEFDDMSLTDAVAEMNRYSRKPIVLVGAQGLAGLRISGLFRTGDEAGFARAVAELYGLSVHEHEDRIELRLR